MKKLINFINNMRKSEDRTTFLLYLVALAAISLFSIFFFETLKTLIFGVGIFLSCIAFMMVGATLILMIFVLILGVFEFLIENWKK